MASAVKPSPARARPHDPTAWFPVPDLDTLPPRSSLPAPGTRPPTKRRHLPVRPSPARARPHDPNAWLPVPDVDTLPEIVQLLTPAPEAPPKPAERPAPRRKPAPKAKPGSKAKTAPATKPAPATRPAPKTKPAPRTTPVSRSVALPKPEEQWVRPKSKRAIGVKAFAASAALVILIAGVAYAVPKIFSGGGAADPEVRLSLGSEVTTISTDAATVGAVLEAEGVKLRPADEVTPPLDTEITDGLTIFVARAVAVNVDLDGEIIEVRSAAGSAAELKQEVPQLDGTKFVADITNPVKASDPLEDGLVYTFRTPRQVNAFIGPVPEGTVQETLALTVGQFLFENGIFVADGDWVAPALDAPLPTDGTTEIRFLTAAEYAEVGEALTPDILVPIPLGAGGDTSCKGVGPDCVVPGPEGIPTNGNTQVGDATYYEYTPGTCAHLTLPFGTVVTVTNVATGASTTCTVADRGPEAWTGRIIDLTPGVFAAIAPLSQGVVTVEISW